MRLVSVRGRLLLLPLELLDVLPLVDFDDFDSLFLDVDVVWWLLLSLCLRCWAAVATASCNCWRTSADGCDGRALRIRTVVDVLLDDGDAPPSELAGVTVNGKRGKKPRSVLVGSVEDAVRCSRIEKNNFSFFHVGVIIRFVEF